MEYVKINIVNINNISSNYNIVVSSTINTSKKIDNKLLVFY